MLHKNLPSNILHRVLFVRTLLDCVAALQFLLKGDVDNAKAVIKAWKSPMPDEGTGLAEKNSYSSFMSNLPQDVSLSKKNSTLMSYSILWQYYARGKRAFCDL